MLLEEIKKHDTMIIIGETGSGKTTQIPQVIHEQGLEGKGAIAVTQPRKVATITLALRVAAEMRSEIGATVGYTVRFEDVSSVKTKIKYVTDGILLREALSDPLLKKYSVIILDEAHERTVNTDVLFGIIKLAQRDRNQQNLSNLKVIVMSATMDVDSFKNFYNDCPVIYLEGRTFPVTIYHTKTKQDDYEYAALCSVFQLHATTPANEDFLVFLTGQEEIETMMHNIRQIAQETQGPVIRVCPLYAGLPAAAQLNVWKKTPPGARKIVLATNIAEASVTIPDIRYVIDTGVVKERTWCGRTGAERLRVAACSRAAAWQRAGRAGRTAPGAAYRLYTARQLNDRPAHTTPEILRCPLASSLLSLIAMRMDPNTFPLIDPPPQDAVQASLMLLKELGAIDNVSEPKLTVIGKKMTAFPVDPKYAKILLCAPEYNCLEEALSLVSVMSSEDLFYTPMDKREEAAIVKQKFVSPLGDHITLLNVFKAFQKAPMQKQWCKENYVHHKNIANACDIRRQLLEVCRRLNMPLASCGTDTDQILKCLMSGLFTNVAWSRGAGSGAARYVTAGGAAAALHPASALYGVRPPPPAVLYGELVHTRRAHLRSVSAVQPAWLALVAPEYARRVAPR
ncbi:ATP-dependent RNA helicase DHX33 isoform X2 [Aricia agestis]|uniref:ATP-dependent RNA helicase DHX33 isoform X2 n=1 Tax=Aricia agestis TaxID=91739 RepID=UPI001C20A052|nr:ATP-dependent RNA helicase DHX33 isoform X2 [Aricia agestis]